VRILAVDYGTRRIGLAVSDPLGVVASPHGFVDVADDGSHLDTIAQLCTDLEVGRIVVGLPLHMSGEAGASAEAARGLVEALADRVTVPVELFDERLTTTQAERALLECNVRRGRRKQVVDGVAAAVLLGAYLDRARQRSPDCDVG